MFINLTPHAINLPSLTVPPSGKVARCAEITTRAGECEGVALVTKDFGDVSDLPDPVEGTVYIVSMKVRQALPHRHDLASPGDLTRDDKGQITGAKNLAVNR